MVKLSDYVIQFIADLGVKHIFMLPGGGAMHLVDSVGRNKNIEYVCNLHEQACAIAAEAYARVTNNIGVALVTTGPGGTNTITGVAGAWLDSTPCLFLSGQVKRADIAGDSGLRQLGVQEISIVSIVKPICKYAVTVLDPNTICFHLQKAVYLAKSGRPGPVWVDIPLDVQASQIDPEILAGFETGGEAIEPLKPKDADINRTIELLSKAERPVILAGNGVRLAGAQSEFLELVKKFGVPVLTTRLGVDLIPSDHPLSMGMPGSIAARFSNYVLQNADFLLILGARMDMALMAYSPENLARAANKVMVNVDLPEMLKLKAILDVIIHADAKEFIQDLTCRMEPCRSNNYTTWVERCQGWKKKYPFVLPEHHKVNEKISVYAFSDILSEELGEDCVILPGSAGNASELFLTAFKAKRGQRIFHNKGTGAMGFCQPAAIGACLANGGKTTICVDGDGGFQLNIQEMETIRRLGLPIKFFVMNNNGYASIRASQQTYFRRLAGADSTCGMTLPDIVGIARAYGVEAIRLNSRRNLREKIRHVLTSPGPVVCDIMIIPDEPRAPRTISVQRPDGSMITKPLEDMWPFLDREEFLSNMIVPPITEDNN